MRDFPERQGLYDPIYEKDACGIGFVANIDGDKSHQTIDDALTVLENLSHRGASGADPDTGDGAGISLQIPHSFYKRACKVLGVELPKDGEYGVANLFVHRYEDFRNVQKAKFQEIVEKEGLSLLGWRDVPVNDTVIGESAKRTMPFMLQAFIGKPKDLEVGLPFERKLFTLRKKAETEIIPLGYEKGGTFYIPSCSSKLVVYKGMLTSEQLRTFYLDLSDLDFTSALAMVHSRFSTNTFPSWERAHPNRMSCHNGEINTIRGNVNWMKARQKRVESDAFNDMNDIFPIIDETGSDSSMFDNSLEFLYLTGRSLPHAMMMMIPEPWEKDPNMSESKKEFYKFHNFLMEPWEGPAAMAFTDGDVIGGTLDRNGLRPSRYYITKKNNVILASEVGVLDIPADQVRAKGKLQAGKMLLIDTIQKKIIADKEIKEEIATQYPYNSWNEEHLITLDDFETSKGPRPEATSELVHLQKAFGWTYEDIHKVISPMALEGKEAIGAMGIDSPLAVLSDKPHLLYNYFKQLFAQVTNPPIDGIREVNVTSSTMILGSVGNMLNPHEGSSSSIILDEPILSNGQLKQIKEFDNDHFKTETISLLYKVSRGPKEMERALKRMFKKVDNAVLEGKNLFLLSDRGVNDEYAAIPTLLAASGLHQHLIKNEIRTDVGLIVETGDAREVHHFATLIGFGVTAINPYMAFETIKHLVKHNYLGDITYKEAKKNYIKASTKGIMKVITKMGISTLRSYHGAQIFEAIGVGKEVIDKYFTNVPSRLDGIGMIEIATENEMRHKSAFGEFTLNKDILEVGGTYQYKDSGEEHHYNPESIYLLQKATRENDYNLFKDFSKKINDEQVYTLRNLLDFQYDPSEAIPIEEVEPVEAIVTRFKSGAMSYGSISHEAHTTLAIAMNRLGAKSNSGEGGENIKRFKADENGDSMNSAIKQIASGRFGVTSNYLVNAEELQIKMAQGAKPGEGGHLPGKKVFPAIAKVRHSTPGVGLISPPPHHDIYSIEDLAELIHDLKNANRKARINVKLVSEIGVGTIAAGVAKGKADVILISGYDGGTGASPLTSIKHAGLPWELGLREAHQTLVLNKLRDRVVLETDGKLLTGRDVIIAALLGAEEYGFATAPLVTMGCVMMRVCNLNTCPVGIATQDESLRKYFTGKPEYIVNFMHFVAQEMREIMAKLGIKSVDELIGRTDKLKVQEVIDHWKASKLDLSPILYTPYSAPDVGQCFSIPQQHHYTHSTDYKVLMNLCKPALEHGKPVQTKLLITNTDRVAGTLIGSEISKKYGEVGLPSDTIQLTYVGSAGQSFAAFVPSGMTMKLEGDANDYIGKGLSGGKVVVTPPTGSSFIAKENVIIGNVAFYGATSGEAYINGIAGERFCVRNSGVEVVVEGVGDHACEYMTGGKVVILGETGLNFAAGMSGGVAYVLDFKEENLNRELVVVEKLNEKDQAVLKEMLEKHADYVDSKAAKDILSDFDNYIDRFTKIIPEDYKLIIESLEEFKANGMSNEEAMQAAFQKATA